MDIKEHPNHKLYIQVLRQMSPEKRLLKAFELSEFSKKLFIHGLHRRFPNLQDKEFKKILLERLDKCHNEKLDKSYLEHWAKKLDIESLLKRLIDEAEIT